MPVPVRITRYEVASERPDAIEIEYGPAPLPVIVAVGTGPLLARTNAETVTDADHDPIRVEPNAVEPAGRFDGGGATGAVRSPTTPATITSKHVSAIWPSVPVPSIVTMYEVAVVRPLAIATE